jgi:hypothetical protein
MVALHTLRQLRPDGRIAAEECQALLVHVQHCPATRRGWQAWIDQLYGQLQTVMASANASHARDVNQQLAPLCTAVCARIGIARHRLQRSAPRELQASLFDRRVERLAVARQRATDRLDAALLRRALSLAPAISDVALRPRLFAVWPLER